MKTTSKFGGLIFVISLVLASVSARADVVYDNTTFRSDPELFSQSGYEFGDEVVISGTTSRYLTNFIFEYYGVSFSGDEQMRLRLYRNDGVQYGTNILAPGTLLYDSDFFNIGGFGSTTGSTLSFENINIPVPTNFTWTVEFDLGTGSGESAGLALYNGTNGPSVGQGYSGYWEYSGTSGWALRVSTNDLYFPINYGARAEAETNFADVTSPTLAISASSPSGDITDQSTNITGTAVDLGSGLALILVKHTTPYQTNNWRPISGLVGSPWTNSFTMDPGTNSFSFKAVDRAGNDSVVSGSATRTIFYAVTDAITLVTNGAGNVTVPADFPNLFINRGYTFTAVPDSLNYLSNWVSYTTGGPTNTTTTASVNIIGKTNQTLIVNFGTNAFLGNFVPLAKYNGLFNDPTYSHRQSGWIQIKTKAPNKFSGKITIEGESKGFSGTFNTNSGVGTLKKPILLKEKLAPNSISIYLNAGADQMTGTVVQDPGVVWTSDLIADIAPVAVPAAVSNAYTLILPSSGNPGEPAGHGWATISVDPLKAVKGTKAIGYFGDGQKTKMIKSTIATNGYWPFYSALYRTNRGVNVKTYNGSVVGWLQFTNGFIEGALTWNKIGWTNGLYDAGFTNIITVNSSNSSPLVEQLPTTKEINITNFLVTLAGGNLTTNVTQPLSYVYSPGPKVPTVKTPAKGGNNTNYVKAAFAKKGKLTGSFGEDPPALVLKRTVLRGAVLQFGPNADKAYGVFTGTNASGSVTIEGTP